VDKSGAGLPMSAQSATPTTKKNKLVRIFSYTYAFKLMTFSGGD
jgi:hypothetical protein